MSEADAKKSHNGVILFTRPSSAMISRFLRALAERLLLLSLGIFFALVVAEFALRLIIGHPLLPLIPPEPYIDNAVLYQRVPSRRYELRPNVEDTVGDNQVHIRINAAGFRDDQDYPISKPPGTYRVVVLGDSFTFAGKVAFPDTMPQRLVTLLQQSDPSRHYEVLNWGVPGYNAEQEMLLLKEKALAYQPDLVIVNLTLNDAQPMGQLSPAESHLPLSLRQALKRFYLVQFAYAAYQRLSVFLTRGRLPGDSDVASMVDGTPGWQRAKGALAELKQLTFQNGAQLLVVVWPMLTNLDDGYPYKAQHALLTRACESYGIPVFDLFGTFKGQPAASLWAASDDHHPNSLAQEMATVAIFKALNALQLNSPPPPK
jgi:lysophospholipase L1-like esterase